MRFCKLLFIALFFTSAYANAGFQLGEDRSDAYDMCMDDRNSSYSWSDNKFCSNNRTSTGGYQGYIVQWQCTNARANCTFGEFYYGDTIYMYPSEGDQLVFTSFQQARDACYEMADFYRARDGQTMDWSGNTWPNADYYQKLWCESPREESPGYFCVGFTDWVSNNSFFAFPPRTNLRCYWEDNEAPRVVITSPSGDSIQVERGTTLGFSGYGTDREDSNTDIDNALRWQVNGQVFGSGKNASYTFNAAGSFTVRLSVQDAQGVTGEDTILVLVADDTLCEDHEILRGGRCVPISSVEGAESPNDGDPGSNCVGNPVNVATGNKYQKEVDFVALGEAPLSYSRSYNSNTGRWIVDPRSRIETQFTQSKNNSSFYQKRVDWIRKDGKRVYFYSPDISSESESLLAGAVYKSSAVAMKLTQLSSSSSDPNYYQIESGSQILVFNSSGVLQSVEYRSGVRHVAGGLKHSYQQVGDVLTITHTNGSRIQLTFDGDQIQSLVDTWGNEYTYGYEGGMLTKVYYPDGDEDSSNNPFKEYKYQNGNLLYQIVDEEGKLFRQWRYDSNDKVQYSGFDYPAHYHTDKREFRYYADRTEVDFYHKGYSPIGPSGTFSKTRMSTYRFEMINGEKKVVQIDGDPTPSCSRTQSRTVYDENGFVDKTTDWDGDVTDYKYNEFGQLEKVVEGYGSSTTRTTEYIWSPLHFGLLEKIIAPKSTTEIGYEDLGANVYKEVHTVTDNSNLDISVFSGKLPSSMATINTQGAPAPSMEITYEFYDSKVLKSRKVKMFVPGMIGFLAAEVAPHIEEYYNENGMLTKRVDNGILVTNYQYNSTLPYKPPNGSTDANGVQTTYEYTARGWLDLVTIVAPSGSEYSNSITDYDYYKNGLLKSVAHPNGNTVSYEYNYDRYLVETISSTGERLHTGISADTFGWTALLGMRDGKVMSILKREHNELGEVAQTYYEKAFSIAESYGVATNDFDKTDKKSSVRRVFGVRSHVNELGVDGKETVTHYDALDQIDYVVNAKGQQYDYKFDDGGDLRSITDPRGLVHSRFYDGVGRLRYEGFGSVTPYSGVTQYRDMFYWYNPLGNISYIARGSNTYASDSHGGSVEYIYQQDSGRKNLGLLSKEVRSNGEEIEYFYDDDSGEHSFAKGRLYRVVGDKYQTDYDYDHLGNVVRETKIINGKQYVTSYKYNESSELREMVYPSGRVITYHRDQGRVRSIDTDSSNIANSIKYLPFSDKVTDISYSSGYTQSYKFGRAGELDMMSVTSADQTLVDVNYGIDNFFRIDAIERQGDDPRFQESASYQYDDLDQLAQYTSGDLKIIYKYDDSNNRTYKERYVSGVLQASEVNMHGNPYEENQAGLGPNLSPTNSIVGMYTLNSDGELVNSNLIGSSGDLYRRRINEGITFDLDETQRIERVYEFIQPKASTVDK